MASGRTPGMDREASLRRVAIVLSNLPAPLAAKLLGSMDADSKQAVRRTMSTLMDVDPLEQRRALQAFKGTVVQQASSTNLVSADGDALQIQSDVARTSEAYSARVLSGNFPLPRQSSLHDEISSKASVSERRLAADRKIERVEKDSEPWSLASLDRVDHTTLARLLRSEHPQTIALVLASISPEQAARVLPCFGPDLRQETISRIGRLGEVPAAALIEVAEHFRHRLEADQSREQPSLGRQALDAILAAMPAHQPIDAETRDIDSPDAVSQRDLSVASHRRDLDRDSIREDPSYLLIERLRYAERSRQNPQQRQPLREDAAASVPSRAERSADGDRSRRSSEAIANTPRSKQLPWTTVDSSPDETETNHDSHRAFPSAEAVHDHLIELTPMELCQSLGLVDARDAMLTLCGLPVEVSEAALSMLPRAQAKQARARMNSLGSLQLREIDRAKASVAEASMSLLLSPALSISRAA